MELKTIILTIIVILIFYFVIRYLTSRTELSGLENAKSSIKVDKSLLAANRLNPASNFTYSIWFNIDSWNYRYGEPKILFERSDGNGKPCPSVVLDGQNNDLLIKIACYPGANQVHTCKIQNIPIQKWNHLLLSVYGKSLDVYIDGKLVKTCLLPGLAKVNHTSDVFVTPNGGFSGSTAKFQYFDKASNPQQAWNLYAKGWSNNSFSFFNKTKVVLSLYNNDIKTAELSSG